jgi:hypothetical protein
VTKAYAKGKIVQLFKELQTVEFAKEAISLEFGEESGITLYKRAA